MPPTSLARMRAIMLVIGLLVAAGCGTATLSEEEQNAREALRVTFAGWRPIAARDLQRADLQTWQAGHPKANPGMTAGDFFGDQRPAYAFLLTRQDSIGTWARLVVLGGTEGGRYESFVLFTESPIQRMPAIHTSRPNEYQVFIGEQMVPVPTDGVVYEKFDGQKKLFFWNNDRFQDIELTEAGGG